MLKLSTFIHNDSLEIASPVDIAPDTLAHYSLSWEDYKQHNHDAWKKDISDYLPEEGEKLFTMMQSLATDMTLGNIIYVLALKFSLDETISIDEASANNEFRYIEILYCENGILLTTGVITPSGIAHTSRIALTHKAAILAANLILNGYKMGDLTNAT